MNEWYRLGLGAPVPVKDAFNTLNSSSSNNKLDDKLRQRLLGRNAKKFMQLQQQQRQQAAQARGKTGQDDAVIAQPRGIEEEDDEEEGEEEGEGEEGEEDEGEGGEEDDAGEDE